MIKKRPTLSISADDVTPLGELAQATTRRALVALNEQIEEVRAGRATTKFRDRASLISGLAARAAQISGDIARSERFRGKPTIRDQAAFKKWYRGLNVASRAQLRADLDAIDAKQVKS